MKSNILLSNVRKNVGFSAIALFFCIIIASLAYGQAKFADQEFILKFTEAAAEKLSFGFENSIALTGIESIDDLNRRFEVQSIERVFRSAGKYESRHEEFGLTRIYRFSYKSDVDAPVVCEEYKSDTNVQYVQPNYKNELCDVFPNDSHFSEQWALHNTGQRGETPDADIDAPEAWQIEKGNSSVIIGIIDTGIDLDHPDLDANIWINTDEIPGNGIDDDGNGYTDDYYGYDISDDDPNPDDYYGHGSHCAGIAAMETDNWEGGAGTSWYCQVMAVKVFPNSFDDVCAEGIIYAADNGAIVLSNSWGKYGTAPLIYDALVYAQSLNCVTVFAAGNDDTDTPHYPAYYALNIAVAATNYYDYKASFSNYGNWIDVSAPGADIFSCWLGGGYSTIGGTSMSTPFVAGVAGLVFSQHPSWTNDQVRARIEDSADNIDALNPGYEGLLGTGRLNAYKAVTGGPWPNPPENLSATVVGGNDVKLTWGDPTENTDGTPVNLDHINVFRDGSKIAEVGSGVETYTDMDLLDGYYTYWATAVNVEGGESSVSNTSSALIGEVDVLIWRHPEVLKVNVEAKARQRGLSVSEVEAMVRNPVSAQAIKDALEVNCIVAMIVPDITAIDLSQFQAIFVVVGVFPNNHFISAGSAEALAIANYISSGGKVYMEGGDVWCYDPFYGGHNFNPLFQIDPINDGGDDLGTILGQNFAVGMDFTYSGHNNYIDRLGTLSSAFVVHENQFPAYNCGIAYDEGSYKTIGTSFEFGGLDDASASSYTRTDLMAAYIDFLGLEPTHFPDIEVDPLSFDVTLRPDGNIKEIMTIENIGQCVLYAQITDIETGTVTSSRLVSFESKGKVQATNTNTPTTIEAATYRYEGPLDDQVVVVYSSDWDLAPGNSLLDRALQRLGVTYTGFFADPDGFSAALMSADIALIDCPSNEPHWSDVEAYIAAGGKIAISTWAPPTSLFNAMGVTPIESIDTLPVYWWELGHPIFNQPDDVPNFTDMVDDHWWDNGDKVEPLLGYTAIGGFTISPAPNEAAMVVHNGAQTIYNSFLVTDNNETDLDGDGVPDAVELWGNEFTFLSGIGAPWLSENPTDVTIFPGDSEPIYVTFDATGLTPGNYYAQILISSNDPDDPVVTVDVHLLVESLNPDIEVDPLSFDVSVPQGGTTTEIMTIGNEGEGRLEYNIIEAAANPPLYSAQTSRTGNIESLKSISQNFFKNTQRKLMAKPHSLQKDNNENGGPPTKPKKPISDLLRLHGKTQILAWIAYTDYDQEYANTLNAITQFYTDLTITETATTNPAVLQSELMGKNVFLVPEPELADDETLAELGAAFSTVLNDFVSNGGTVIVCCEWSWYQGFLLNSGLMAATFQNGYWEETVTFDVVDPSHPLSQGLGSTVAAANAVASYSITNPDIQNVIVDGDGYPVLAARDIGLGHVVLNGYDYYAYHDDAARIIANAVQWIGKDISWLAENPTYETVLPGESKSVDVTFDATDLDVGDYYAQLLINSKDPGEPTVTVSVTMHVMPPGEQPLLWVEDAYGAPGTTDNPMDIGLENEMGVYGVQFTAVFDGNLLTATEALKTGRSAAMTIAYNIWQDSIKVLLYSTTGDFIAPGIGSIVQLLFDVAESAPLGDSTLVHLKDAKASDEDGNPLAMDLSLLTEDGWFHFRGMKGDINQDGVVDIFDLVKLINFILGKAEPTPYELWAGDINDDGVLDIFDVVKMINIILSGNPTALAKMSFSPAQNGELSLPDVALIPEQTTEVPIYATFDGTVAGVQLVLRYDPQTLKVSSPVLTSRTDQMELASAYENSKLTILIYSASGRVIEAGDGPILTFPVEALSEFKGATRLEVDNAIAVNGKAEAISVNFSTGNIAAAKPKSYLLAQNYPNPFNSETKIKFQLSEDTKVTIKVYNLRGEEVRTLVDKDMGVGYHNVIWDGRDNTGSSVATGVYIYRMDAGSFTTFRKMAFLK